MLRITAEVGRRVDIKRLGLFNEQPNDVDAPFLNRHEEWGGPVLDVL